MIFAAATLGAAHAGASVTAVAIGSAGTSRRTALFVASHARHAGASVTAVAIGSAGTSQRTALFVASRARHAGAVRSTRTIGTAGAIRFPARTTGRAAHGGRRGNKAHGLERRQQGAFHALALVAARAFAVGRFRTRAGDCVAGRFNHGGLRIEGDRHGGNARDRGEGGLYRSGAAAADHIGVDFQIMGRHDLDAGRSRGKDAFVCEARNGKGHIHATPQFNALSGELRRRLMQYSFYVGSSFPSGFFFEVRLCLGWTPGRRSKLYSDFSLVRTCYLWTVKIRCNSV
jgi:hypothetical protein